VEFNYAGYAGFFNRVFGRLPWCKKGQVSFLRNFRCSWHTIAKKWSICCLQRETPAESHLTYALLITAYTHETQTTSFTGICIIA